MTDRVNYGIASAIAALVVTGVVAFAVDFRDPCGPMTALVVILFFFPATIIIAGLAAIIGYALGAGVKRYALIVEAAILAIALAFIGASQLVPGFNPPSDQRCTIDF